MSCLEALLLTFAKERKVRGKGPLCVALFVTRKAKELGLPLKQESLLTGGEGQVSGLSKANIQAILSDHGITRVLAEEGGRTSRGSIGLARSYVEFLNNLNSPDLDKIETWWVDQVRIFFRGKPFVLRFDPSKSLRIIIQDLLAQAEKRQKQVPGTMYLGAVMQHLVGAKLDLVMDGLPMHHGSCVADVGTGRDADFLVGDTSIHVTSSPSESLIRKCRRNLENSLHPLIVTVDRGLDVAAELANQLGIEERVEVLSIEQFLSSNIYEHGNFKISGRLETTRSLIDRYNEIIDQCETDPSLKIDLGK